jgi:hypothetical protein
MAEYPHAEAEAALVEWQLAQLKELVEIQMEVVRELPRKVAGLKPEGAATDEVESAVQLTNAHNRVAAAVQKSLALQSKLIEERRLRWLGLEEVKAKRQEGAVKAKDEASSRGRRRLAEIAKDMAHTLRVRDVRSELVRSLLRSVEDKLATDDLYDNLSHFGQDPIGVTLAKLVKSAKIQLDWRVFKDEAWAQPEIAARDTRSPFAFLWRRSRDRRTVVRQPIRLTGPAPSRVGHRRLDADNRPRPKPHSRPARILRRLFRAGETAQAFVVWSGLCATIVTTQGF